MGQDPSAIRADIAATREHMSQTVDALIEKAESRVRPKERLISAKNAWKSRASAKKNQMMTRTRDYATHPGLAARQATGQARHARDAATQHPRSLMTGAVTVAALAAGFVLLATRARHRQQGLAPRVGPGRVAALPQSLRQARRQARAQSLRQARGHVRGGTRGGMWGYRRRHTRRHTRRQGLRLAKRPALRWAGRTAVKRRGFSMGR